MMFYMLINNLQETFVIIVFGFIFVKSMENEVKKRYQTIVHLWNITLGDDPVVICRYNKRNLERVRKEAKFFSKFFGCKIEVIYNRFLIRVKKKDAK